MLQPERRKHLRRLKMGTKYEDYLWQKALDRLKEENEMMRKDLVIEGGEVIASAEEVVTTEDLKIGIDNLEGMPPEQIRSRIGIAADELIEHIEHTLGWPLVVNTYDDVRIKVSIVGTNDEDEDDELELTFFPLDDDDDFFL